MMLRGFGWIVFAVGVSSADSTNVFIPFALTVLGILMLLHGSEEEE